MKKRLSVLMVMAVLCLVFASQSYASCTRKCTTRINIYYTYKEKENENRHKKWIEVEKYTTEGRYGGNCNLPSGRQKAKERAIIEAKKIATNKYFNKKETQQKALCDNIPDDIKDNADWFKIDYISVSPKVEPNSNRLNKAYRMSAASQDTFTCTPPSNTGGSSNSGGQIRWRIVSTTERNHDRPGSDYKSFMTSSTNFATCQSACKQAFPKCKAWTYVKAGVQGAKAKCWLKNSRPSKVPNTNCTSGWVNKVPYRTQ